MKRFIRLTTIVGVPVFVHWSVVVVCSIFVLAAFPNPIPATCALVSYLGVLLIHEAGHVLMAKHLGHSATSVELYPIHGITCIVQPDAALARSMIAWGGVLAQMVVATPLVLWMVFLGFTSLEPINAILVVLGGYNLIVASLNLLPIRPLDGVEAWQVVPLLLEAFQSRAERADLEKIRRRTKSKLRLM